MRNAALLALCLAAFSLSKAQDPIAQANKCYEEKNYQCAINFYSDALTNNKYKEKDYSEINYRLGYAYQKLEKHNDAISYFQKVIERSPDFKEAFWNIGYSYFKTQNYQKALDNYNKAISYYTAATDLRSLLYWKARTYSALGKYAEALATAKEAMEKDPKYDNAYGLAGDASYNMSKYGDAVNYYRKAIELSTGDEKSQAARYYWKGKSYFNLYKYDSAKMDFQKVLEYDPTYKSAVWEIAAVYYNQSKWTDAVAQYSRTMPFYTGDTASLKTLYYLRGYCYEKSGDLAKAIADFDAALKIDPSYLNPLDHKASVLFEQKKYKDAIALYAKAIEADKDKSSAPVYYAKKAKAYLILKDTAKALDELRMGQYHDPDQVIGELSIELGNINFARKKYSDAATHYDAALQEEWDYYEDDKYMGMLFLRKGISNLVTGNYYTASSDLEESVAYDSLNREAHRYLAEAYYAKQSYSSAIKEFTTALSMYRDVKDSLVKLYTYRGRTYSYQKEYQKALADYEQADKLKPNNIEIVTGIGQLAFETKDYPKVISTFTKAIGMYKPTQKNELAFAYYARGRAYYEQKNKAMATADMEKAIELLPTYTDAKTWLAAIKNSN